jgi:hypothetical protein
MEEQIMTVRTNVRASGAVLMLMVSMIGLQGLATPAVASSRAIHATGTETLTGAANVELVPRGGQCVIYVDQAVKYEGALDGRATSVRPSQIRYLATCDKVLVAGGVGIPSTFRAVTHFVSADGTVEATLRSVGSTNTSGDYKGIETVQGDLNGILQVAGSPFSSPTATYEGSLFVTG